MKFDDYFSLFDIVKALSAWRIKSAAARHPYQLYWSQLLIGPTEERRDVTPAGRYPSAVSDLLPPRKHWHRSMKEARKAMPASMVAALSIIRTVSGYEKAGRLASTNWGRRLLGLHDGIRSQLAAGAFSLHKPTIRLIRKGTGRVHAMNAERRKSAYRSLATFDNLADRILIGKTTTYLRDLFDSELKDCCYAFRKNGKRFSFRSAVGNLVEYRKKHSDKTLYVADCDVQKFFDVINHDVIRGAFDSFVQRVADRRPDPRARRLLEAYLGAYAFPSILDECQDAEVVRRRDCVARVPESVLKALYPSENIGTLRLGIPQGGALSPLLANIVMDAVDRAVLSDSDPDLFYARYCDDMVIVHPDRRKCLAALRRYLDAMELLKLPIHKFGRRARYAASYFTEKSKGPVAWKKTAVGLPGTRWVSFLGHQIRYDGEVRIRKETLMRHQDKMKQEKLALLHNLLCAKGRYRQGVCWKDLLRTFQMRLTAIGVGRIDKSSFAPFTRSWLSVFIRHLRPGGPAEKQLRNLDRTRGGVVACVKGILKESWWNLPPKSEAETREKASGGRRKVRRGYFGAPFSYLGSLREVPRPRLQDAEVETMTPDAIDGYSSC